MRSTRDRSIPLLVAVALLTTACASAGAPTRPAPTWHTLALGLPAMVAGFAVQPEPVTAAALRSGGPHSLLRGGAVYSLRRSNQLAAVLEVGELDTSVSVDDLDVQRGLAGQIGQSVPRVIRLLGHTVYEGTAPDEQSVFTWFSRHRMCILMTRGVRDPRPLLQGLLQVAS